MWPISSIRRYFRNRQRGIFRFHDGDRWHYVDPLVAWSILTTDPDFDWEHDPLSAEAGDVESMKRTAAASCKAFGLQPLDAQGRGVTMGEAIDILIDYNLWTNGVKKKSSKEPISSEPTESPNLLPTSSNSDSSSISPELKSDAPSIPSMR